LAAARELILAQPTPPSIDAVAAQAGVARMTVYYQFGSKVGLLEALFDGLGGPHFQSRLPGALAHPDPLDALDELIEVFLSFWSEERLVVRRVRGMGALDSDFEKSLRGRDERRRQLLRMVLVRISEQYGRPPLESLDETIDILYVLTSFATFDTLAGEGGTFENVVHAVQHLARLLIGVDNTGSNGG
jgi:AcrR family transcriptional regulator